MNNKPHPSHDLEWCDSSHYDFVCKNCDIADTPSGWSKLMEPCVTDEKAMGVFSDTPQKQLERMAWYFSDVGIYTKANYCHEIIEYINQLENKVNESKG